VRVREIDIKTERERGEDGEGVEGEGRGGGGRRREGGKGEGEKLERVTAAPEQKEKVTEKTHLHPSESLPSIPMMFAK